MRPSLFTPPHVPRYGEDPNPKGSVDDRRGLTATLIDPGLCLVFAKMLFILVHMLQIHHRSRAVCNEAYGMAGESAGVEWVSWVFSRPGLAGEAKLFVT